MVPESENGSPEDGSASGRPGRDRAGRWWSGDEKADAVWFALADELARNRTSDPSAELIVPWQSTTVGDVRALMDAYREARALVQRLRAALTALGLGDQFPGLGASVDADGKAIVTLGAVSVGAAERLEAVLRSSPPPSDRRAA
ncbi:hypothetical protein KIH74_20085 [Kineosporia sp. J2-2]|uniref:Uncharacterized protein n=1 Tax=Kineosporia corallincola TaxID=2835133 RepID=A0ABS5TJR0_9ACTN|nr:hypothetical protein [Kineosporia corallincola]MBT0771250.1 hypothetical protein [Kineosporia corallincola]